MNFIQGDSGGPLFMAGKQVGIVSLGFVLCLLGTVIYTFIAAFRAFIESVIGN